MAVIIRNTIILIIGLSYLFQNIWVSAAPRRISTRYFSSRIPRDGQLLMEQNFQILCSLKPTNEEGNGWTLSIQESILNQISKPGQSREEKYLNEFLTAAIVSSIISNCGAEHEIANDQPTEADSLGMMRVENILQNVFSGNLYGILKANVSAPSREQVSSTVSSIFRTLLTNISSISNYAFGSSSNSSTSTTSSTNKALTFVEM